MKSMIDVFRAMGLVVTLIAVLGSANAQAVTGPTSATGAAARSSTVLKPNERTCTYAVSKDDTSCDVSVKLEKTGARCNDGTEMIKITVSATCSGQECGVYPPTFYCANETNGVDITMLCEGVNITLTPSKGWGSPLGGLCSSIAATAG